MSYRRSFHKTIAIHYSGSVSYPASQSGGSVSYSGTAYEDVTVNIHVDTDPFDDSVSRCNNTVNLLTGAVVATEAAQVESIRKNSLKVGQTIVDGFFKTVHSEVSQQIAELKIKVETTLGHLYELAQRCTDKQRQMEVDYNRLCSRYIKTFEDLNKELYNRIIELDRPTFVFRKTCEDITNRSQKGDMVTTIAVGGQENSALQARIGASVAKKRAYDTIGVTNKFLAKQKQTENILQNCIINESDEAVEYMPICFVETNNSGEVVDRKVYHSDILPPLGGDIIDLIDANYGWRKMSDGQLKSIKQHFNTEVSAHYKNADTHQERVRDCINQLFNNDSIKVVK